MKCINQKCASITLAIWVVFLFRDSHANRRSQSLKQFIVTSLSNEVNRNFSAGTNFDFSLFPFVSPSPSLSLSASTTPSPTSSASQSPSATISASSVKSPSSSYSRTPKASLKASRTPNQPSSSSKPSSATSAATPSSTSSLTSSVASSTPKETSTPSASAEETSSPSSTAQASIPTSSTTVSPSAVITSSSTPSATISSSVTPSPTLSQSASSSVSSPPSPSSTASSSPSQSSACTLDCKCEDPGELLGDPSFDESELVNFGSGQPSVWSASIWDLPNNIFRSDPVASNIEYGSDALQLSITENSGVYKGAGVRTQTNWYGYGCVSACMRPSAVSGVISSLFTYTSQYDGINGSTPNHNEIDIEFEGFNTTRVQFNYYVDKTSSETQNHEKKHTLGFDASASFNVFGFKWTPWAIEWVVNGNTVYTVLNEGAKGTPVVTDTTVQKIMANLWVVSEDIEQNFGGEFDEASFTGTISQYEWIRYDKLDEFGCCEISATFIKRLDIEGGVHLVGQYRV